MPSGWVLDGNGLKQNSTVSYRANGNQLFEFHFGKSSRTGTERGENEVLGQKTCPNMTMSTTNCTRIGMGLNLRLNVDMGTQ